jgi:hypothetical protein
MTIHAGGSRVHLTGDLNHDTRHSYAERPVLRAPALTPRLLVSAEIPQEAGMRGLPP